MNWWRKFCQELKEFWYGPLEPWGDDDIEDWCEQLECTYHEDYDYYRYETDYERGFSDGYAQGRRVARE